MRKLKLSQLQMLVAVVNSGGFGRAAAELGCTQSRISHAISELEEILGTRMLLRSRTGCAPTDTGHRVVAQARQMLNLADILVEGAKDDLSVVGRVRIACFRSIGTHLLPRVLEALAVEFPGIRVDVDDNCEERDEVTLAVEERRADIGIAQLPISPGLVSRPYISDSYVVVAPSSLPLREPFSWEQIIDVPYIQLKCSGAQAVLERCRKAGFHAETSRTLATDSGIVAMIKQGMGCSFLPHLAVFPPPNGVKIFDLPILARRQFALVALPSSARLKSVQVVMRFIHAERNILNTDAFRAGIVRR